MFEIREPDLTWEIIGRWPTSYTDADYHVRLPNPLHARYPEQDKYLHHWYLLKGGELLYLIKSGDRNSDHKFRYIEIFSLKDFSLHTEPLIVERPPSIINSLLNGSAFRSDIVGERYFKSCLSLPDLLPVLTAFTLLYPLKHSLGEAITFGGRIKHAIHHQKTEQDAAANP
jgi:hypothetical protein